MKGNKALAILAMLGLMTGAVACGTAEAKDGNTPGGLVPPAPDKYLITVTGEDFAKDVNIKQQVEVKAGQVFTIALDSNGTTGFQWTEQAIIANPAVLTQTAHQYIEPANGETPVVGMGGFEEWTFKAGQAGTTLVSLSYGRPWEGGEKDARTFELTVTVK